MSRKIYKVKTKFKKVNIQSKAKSAMEKRNEKKTCYAANVYSPCLKVGNSMFQFTIFSSNRNNQ